MVKKVKKAGKKAVEEQEIAFDPAALLKGINFYHLILVIILVFGFVLRYYHVDYPVVGYHNWKEAHYLTEARNFDKNGLFKKGVFVPELDWISGTTDSEGAHTDTFPSTSIIIGIAFRIFGADLAIARIINIMMAIGSILLFYLIIKRLFNNENLALVSAFIMAINPLLIFFGRQVQLINAALFFSLAGIYFYLRWIENFSWTNTVLFSSCLMIGIVSKYSFAIFGLPLLFLFPFKRLVDKELWTKFFAVAGIVFLFSSWVLYSYFNYGIDFGARSAIQQEITSVNTSKLRDPGFWLTMKSYVADNYSTVGLNLAIIGAVFFIGMFILLKKKNSGYIFFLSYLIFSIPWFIIMSFKLGGHNYHQYPIMPLVVFFMAYLFTLIANTAKNIMKSFSKSAFIGQLVFFLVASIFIMMIFKPSMEAKNRMFDTQFQGLDTAGEYIKSHKLPGETLMHSSHQAYGITWHGDIKGSGGIPANISEYEEKNNAEWLFIYQWDMNILNEGPRAEYIRNNYRVVQFGFNVLQNQQLVPVYLLMKKGGVFDEAKINDALQDQSKIGFRDYEYFNPAIPSKLFFVNIE
ncbi:MAG: glycosyltransferase family 39 protein [Nanoarchaeota archaeon]|nr:glycosyltransferase family 39 protein [Nanoarchaeota archaeon]